LGVLQRHEVFPGFVDLAGSLYVGKGIFADDLVSNCGAEKLPGPPYSPPGCSFGVFTPEPKQPGIGVTRIDVPEVLFRSAELD
jgi:hypothetical protein